MNEVLDTIIQVSHRPTSTGRDASRDTRELPSAVPPLCLTLFEVCEVVLALVVVAVECIPSRLRLCNVNDHFSVALYR